MDGDRRNPAAAAASVASVLGDDDLLREILLRLGFPNCLVRASLVSKRWLSHASDPAFLRRFRDRHPPRLLGFFASKGDQAQFVQLPRSPVLAALSRRAAASCSDDAAFGTIGHARNGRLIAGFFRDGSFKHTLLAPLLAGESEVALPPIPPPHIVREEPAAGVFLKMFLPEDGSRDGITMVYLWQVRQKVRAEVYVLGSDGWGVPTTAVTRMRHLKSILPLPPVSGKVFMVTNLGCTLGLDVAAASFFTIELPAGIVCNYKLSYAAGSGLYLVSADGFQLSVWLHGTTTGDSDGAGGWLLVDKFCVREAYARSAGHNWVWMAQDGDFLGVAAVGDDAEFVFLDYARFGVVLYVHLRSRVVEKVYEQAPNDHQFISPGRNYIRITPFMMIWPPIFPAPNGGHDQEQ